jgi:hypothetical protein
VAPRVLYVSPEGPEPERKPADPAAKSPARTAAAGGLRIGILDNNKANADHLLKFLVDGLRQRVPVASVVMERKFTASSGAAGDVLERLWKDADLVLSAMAD